MKWRLPIFETLLYMLLVFGTIAYIPSIIISVKYELYLVIILDTVVYLVFLFIFFANRVKYEIKVGLIMILTFLLGIGLIIFVGKDGAGFLWLFAFPPLAAILLGRKQAHYAIWLNMLALLTIEFLVYTGVWTSSNLYTFDPFALLITIVNFLCLTLITVIPLTIIMENLKKAYLKASAGRESIRKKSALILKAKEEAEQINQQKEKVVQQLANHKKILINKNEQLIKINQELDRFVYSVSHDLRAPLTSSLGLIQISRLEKDTSKKEDYLNMINKSLIRLDNFIKELIDFTRNSRTELELEEIDWNELISSILRDLQYLENFNHIQFKINNTLDRPFHSDRNRLKIILSNLVSNSIRYRNKYHHRGSYVKIEVNPENSMVKIKVEDNGVGINQAHIDKIFDMFYRGSPVNAGSGLGLYILKESVTKLHGKVSVSSEINQGTVFEVVLPELN
ncbi:MAG: sensor histidine kinase [Candidatus Cyclobacteriaceae bacterium M3_2C_046]